MVNSIPIKTKMTADAIKDCLTSHLELERDEKGLGRSTKLGCRNIPKKGDENMAFGLTTNKLNSMANKTLEQCGASETIYPSSMSPFGISQEEMQKQRTRNEVTEVLESIGCRFRPAMFQGIWQKAAKNESGGADDFAFSTKVSMTGFLQAMRDLKVTPTA